MKPLKSILSLALVLGLSHLTILAAQLTCCEQAKADGKECKHKCCMAAHKESKSCVKCNPNKQDLKDAKKTDKAPAKPASR